uniref:Classical arabinogalactan protein 26-like n=1 Tax=Davidia involucrata TaxID=16924 RepID=A0A5B7B9R3_DAVIN
MAAWKWLLTLGMVFMAYPSSSLPTSTISAAPAFLPNPPSLSSPPLPTLSPDINPLLPSPGGAGLSPTESSVPTIPSSPSPPNPDATAVAPGPGMAFSPSGSLPDSSSVALNLSGPLHSVMLLLGLLPFWLIQLSGNVS